MANEVLARSGLFFDDLNKIRVINPQAAQTSGELKEEVGEFVTRIVQFEKTVDGFVTIVDTLSKQVEQEKIKAVGSRNLLKSLTKQKEVEEQKLQALIREKQIEMERLRMQYEAMLKEEAEQKEFMQQLLAPM